MKLGKRAARLRRAAKTRHIIARSGCLRVVVHRSGRHAYAQLIDADHKVQVSASTLEKEARSSGAPSSTVAAAREVGERFAAKVAAKKIDGQLAFDRSGFKFHGRIKALAEGMRAGGLKI